MMIGARPMCADERESESDRGDDDDVNVRVQAIRFNPINFIDTHTRTRATHRRRTVHLYLLLLFINGQAPRVSMCVSVCACDGVTGVLANEIRALYRHALKSGARNRARTTKTATTITHLLTRTDRHTDIHSHLRTHHTYTYSRFVLIRLARARDTHIHTN